MLSDEAVGRFTKTERRLETGVRDRRHTHTTPLLKAGNHPTVVAERLGDAGSSMTLDTHSHVMPRRPAFSAVRYSKENLTSCLGRFTVMHVKQT